MSAGVSDVEICNLAYDGQMALLSHRIQEDPSLVKVKDQVRYVCSHCEALYNCQPSVWIFVFRQHQTRLLSLKFKLTWFMHVGEGITFLYCLSCFYMVYSCITWTRLILISINEAWSQSDGVLLLDSELNAYNASNILQTDRTALHWAVSSGKREIVDFLVDSGANVDSPDSVCVVLFLELNFWMKLLLYQQVLFVLYDEYSFPPRLRNDLLLQWEWLLLNLLFLIASWHGLAQRFPTWGTCTPRGTGVHLRLAIEAKYIFTYLLFPNIYTSISEYYSQKLLYAC